VDGKQVLTPPPHDLVREAQELQMLVRTPRAVLWAAEGRQQDDADLSVDGGWPGILRIAHQEGNANVKMSQ